MSDYKHKIAYPFLRILRTVFFPLEIVLCALLIIIPSALFLALRSPENAIDAGQFNTHRQPLPDNVSDEQLTPQQVGNFVLDEPIRNSPGFSQRNLIAVYKTQDGQTVDLILDLLDKNADRRDSLYRGTSCGDCARSAARLFRNGNIVYGYAFCDCFNYAQHTFNWTNGDWVLSASTASTLHGNGNTLLDFVNSYPF